MYSGTAGSLIREDFAKELGLRGENQLVNFGTFHGSDPLLSSRTVELEVIAPHNQRIRFDVTADTTPVLDIESRRWKPPPSSTDWTYLDDISYPLSNMEKSLFF